MSLTHCDEHGAARMVDVSDKDSTVREARAQGWISLSAAAMDAIEKNSLKKGDALATARIAGIQAAKRCSDLIPLCHHLALSQVVVEFVVNRAACRIDIASYCKLKGQTGVEMEALTAVSIAALTLYDMCKAVDKTMCIGDICLVEKTGGRSGHYRREDS